MQKIITENRNENTKDIDIISTLDIVKKINDEDKLVALAVEKEAENIAKAVDVIVDSFLKRRESAVGFVRSSKSVTWVLEKFLFNGIQVSVGYDAVGVQYQYILSTTGFNTHITCSGRSSVFFPEIGYIYLLAVSVNDVLAGKGRTVFYNNGFKVLEGLPGKTSQQFFYFIRTIVDRNDD